MKSRWAAYERSSSDRVNSHTLDVGILVFDGVEVLDFAGPFEVFSVASRVALRHGARREPFRTTLCAERLHPIYARHGLAVLPGRDLSQVPRDVLIVPGGIVEAAMQNEAIVSFIAESHKRSTLVASICTGAFLLARAGLLDGLKATTHWEDLEELRRAAPTTSVIGEARFIDEGRVVTSAGISAGIEMSLHLVRRLFGEGLAARTALQMDYRADLSG